jgi:nitrogen fixation-related uncharacterized protein
MKEKDIYIFVVVVILIVWIALLVFINSGRSKSYDEINSLEITKKQIEIKILEHELKAYEQVDSL